MPYDVGEIVFTGSGINDMAYTVTASPETTYEVEIDGEGTMTIAPVFSGTGINDMTCPSPNYSGDATPATFDVVIDSTSTPAVDEGLYDDFPNLAAWTIRDGTWAVASGEAYCEFEGKMDRPCAYATGTWEYKQRMASPANGSVLNFYFLRSSYSGSGYYMQLYVTSDGFKYRLCQTSAPTVLGEYITSVDASQHSIRITRNSVGLMRVYIDGILRIEVTNLTYTIPGVIGLDCYAPAAAVGYFANVLVNYTLGPGARDTVKYNLNAGEFITGQNLITTVPGLEIGEFRLKANTTTGHISTDIYEIKIINTGIPNKFQWRKNGGDWSVETVCSVYPDYTAIDGLYNIAFKSDADNVNGNLYSFQVDGAVSPDTFKWRKNAEDYITDVPMTAGPILLKEGISVEFTHFTGHTLTDAWAFTAKRDTVKYRDVLGAWTEGQIITGSHQTIISGVQFKFNAINGHTLGNKWSLEVDTPARFGKSHVYKSRLWVIANDKRTVYYSALNLPADFTGSGSGYIDFRFVIPVVDELMDMASFLNYLVFFFKNHIIIYAGTDPTATGDFTIYQVFSDIGLLAPDTVISVDSDIYFLTSKGVKGLKQLLTAGSLNVNNVSAAIEADIIAAIAGNTDSVYGSGHYPKLGILMFLIGNYVFIFNYRQNAWSRMKIPSATDAAKLLSIFKTTTGALYMGGYNYLSEFNPAVATHNFNGVAPVYEWKTGMLKATSADAMYFNELRMRLASIKAVELTLKTRAIGFDTGIEDQAAFNQQTVSIPEIIAADAVFNFVRLPLLGAGKYIQLDFTEAPAVGANNDLEIAAIEVEGELGVL
jgi:hypothetical protein